MRLLWVATFLATLGAAAVAVRLPPHQWLYALWLAALLGGCLLGVTIGGLMRLGLRRDEADLRWAAVAGGLCAAYALVYRLLAPLPAGIAPPGPLDPARAFRAIAALSLALCALGFGFAATRSGSRPVALGGAAALLVAVVAAGPTLEYVGVPAVGPWALLAVAAIAAVAMVLRRGFRSTRP